MYRRLKKLKESKLNSDMMTVLMGCHYMLKINEELNNKIKELENKISDLEEHNNALKIHNFKTDPKS